VESLAPQVHIRLGESAIVCIGIAVSQLCDRRVGDHLRVLAMSRQ